MQNDMNNFLEKDKECFKKRELTINVHDKDLKQPCIMTDEEAEEFVANCEKIDLFTTLRDDEVDMID